MGKLVPDGQGLGVLGATDPQGLEAVRAVGRDVERNLLVVAKLEALPVAAGRRGGAQIHDNVEEGRGKLDRRHEHALPVKDIYLHPLHRRWRQILTTPPAQ